jgi:hypothetical protein
MDFPDSGGKRVEIKCLNHVFVYLFVLWLFSCVVQAVTFVIFVGFRWLDCLFGFLFRALVQKFGIF